MEDDLAFYQRRLDEELHRSENEPTATLRELHRGWAELYRARLRQLLASNYDIAA